MKHIDKFKRFLIRKMGGYSTPFIIDPMQYTVYQAPAPVKVYATIFVDDFVVLRELERRRLAQKMVDELLENGMISFSEKVDKQTGIKRCEASLLVVKPQSVNENRGMVHDADN